MIHSQSTMKIERKITMSTVKKQNIKIIKIFLEKKVLLYELVNIFLGIIISMIAPFISVCYKKIIDYIAVSNDISIIYNVIFNYIIIQTLLEIIENISLYIDTKKDLELNHFFSCQINKKISRMRLEYFENTRVFDLINRISQYGSNNIFDFFEYLSAFISPVVSIVMYSLIVSDINAFFPLLLIGSSVPNLYYQIKLNRNRYETVKKDTKKKRLIQNFVDVLSNREFAKEVRLFHLIDYISNKIELLRIDVYQNNRKNEVQRIKKSCILQVMQNISMIVCLMYTTNLIFQGRTSIGSFILIYNGLKSVTQNIDIFANNLKNIDDFYLYVKDLFDFMSIEENPCDDIKKLKEIKDIELKNVSFKYPNSEVRAIKGISVHFHMGEKIAIVGDNGSGKSTLINLLLGVFSPSDGQILINGQKLQDVLQQYLSLTVCLLQNFVKYQFSAEDNIIIGNGGVQDKTIKNDETLAGIIKQLPYGKMTMLGQLDEDGIDLSGGEWQQIALLRTFYKKIFDLVILDEPFSNIDPIKSEEILNKIFSDVIDKLFILITHNMGHAKKCDRIIVLKEGEIIEEGSHKMLMEKKGHYYELYQSQEKRYSGLV